MSEPDDTPLIRTLRQDLDRGEADAGSDLDILVDFQDTKAGRQVSLLDFIALKQELEASLDMPVDLGERTALQGAVGDKIREEAEPV